LTRLMTKPEVRDGIAAFATSGRYPWQR
jgi:hypothetical protein